jgi:hypothetical protein
MTTIAQGRERPHGTTWRGRRLVRISVSNWSTTPGDVDRSIEAILAAVERSS